MRRLPLKVASGEPDLPSVPREHGSVQRRSLAEQPAARLHDAGAQVVVEVAHVPGDLVEDRGQAESEVPAGPPGVAVGDRQTAQVRGGALDNVAVGTNEVDRVEHCSPEVRSMIGTAGGKPTR